jgi:hypothetical protein
MGLSRRPSEISRQRVVRRSARIWRRRLFCLAALAGVVAAAARPVTAQQGVVRREYAIKAGLISVLAKCVSWPATLAPAPGQPLRIGILGKDPFDENGTNQLDHVAAEAKLKGDNVVVLRFNSAADYQPCHILFVSSEAAVQGAEQTIEQRMQAAQRLAGEDPVLILSESVGMAQHGAVGNLLFDSTSNRIRLEINPDAAARIGLKLAPDLLRLSLVQIVRDPPR